MRCTTCCTAGKYKMAPLFQALKAQTSAEMLRDVIHTTHRDEKKAIRDIYYFPYGVIVFWGFSIEEEKKILKTLKEFEEESFTKAEFDEFTFAYGKGTFIQEDEITLQNKSPLTKLSISHGLAQSVKLTTFEEIVQKTIHQAQTLPRNLANKGRILLSRKEISKKMGELFIERSFVNLHTDILDVPEFFWDHPELEPLYRRTVQYLDVAKRADLLNKRLDVIHDLFEILSNEINHQHSSRLEWTIIILILVEVILALLRDLFHLI